MVSLTVVVDSLVLNQLVPLDGMLLLTVGGGGDDGDDDNND